jgi:hypothetical protein
MIENMKAEVPNFCSHPRVILVNKRVDARAVVLGAHGEVPHFAWTMALSRPPWRSQPNLALVEVMGCLSRLSLTSPMQYLLAERPR